MIIVHDTFVCKPGNASKLAKLFKEWAELQSKEYNSRVMTDMTGQWHRVIMVSEFESLADYEKKTKEEMENQNGLLIVGFGLEGIIDIFVMKMAEKDIMSG